MTAGTSLFATFHIYVVSGGVPTQYPWPVPSQSEEKLLLKSILCLKRRSWFRTSSCMESHKTKFPSDWTSTAPIVVSYEGFEPTENDFEPNTVAYTFCKIFQSEQTNFNSSSAIVNSFPLSGCPQRRSWRRKKKHFLCCGRFHFLLVAFWNTKTYREGKTKTDFTTIATNLAIWLANLPLSIRVQTGQHTSICHAIPFTALLMVR